MTIQVQEYSDHDNRFDCHVATLPLPLLTFLSQKDVPTSQKTIMKYMIKVLFKFDQTIHVPLNVLQMFSCKGF